jgi:hypothetical protein
MTRARVAVAAAVAACALAAGCSGADTGRGPKEPEQQASPQHSIAPRTEAKTGSDMARLDTRAKGQFLAVQELALVQAVAEGVVFDHWDHERSVIDLRALHDEIRTRLGPSAGYADARFALADVTVSKVSVTTDPQTPPDGVNMRMTLEHRRNHARHVRR